MITLPMPPRRTHLKSFGIAISFLVGLIAAGVFSSLAVPHPVLGSLVLITCGGAVALGCTDSLAGVYTLWNAGARWIARRARLFLMAVYYFLVVTVVGQGGARFCRQVRRPGASGWVRRPSANQVSTEPQPQTLGQRPAAKLWLRAYLDWAWRSHNAWAICLLPLLLLLSLLAENEDETLPAYVYTLF